MLRWMVIAALVVALLVAGCLGAPSPAPAPSPTPSPAAASQSAIDVESILQGLLAHAGESFVNIGAVIAGEINFHFTHLDDGVVLVVTSPGGKIGRSTDYGKTWTDLGTIVPGESSIGRPVYLGNGVVVAGTQPNGHIIRSIDYGLTWTDIGIPSPGADLWMMAYLGNNIVLAGTGNTRIVRSTNGGLTWTDIGQIEVGETAITAILNLGNGAAIAATYNNAYVMRSTDWGLTWVNTGTILPGHILIWEFISLGRGIVLAGTSTGPPYTGKVARSTDDGLSWHDMGQPTPDSEDVHNFAYLGDGIVLTGTKDGWGKIARSLDYGLTWTDLGVALPLGVQVLDVCYLGRGVILTSSRGAVVGFVGRMDLGGILEDVASSHCLQEAADVPINTPATAVETRVLYLTTGTGPKRHFLVRSLRLKCADPGANTVTVRLYELMNNVFTVVDTFDIGTAGTPNPFTNYYSLMDMFGVPHLAGHMLMVTVQSSAGSYAITGQYSYAEAK